MDFLKPYKREDYTAFFAGTLLPDDFENCDEKLDVSIKTDYIKKLTKIGESKSFDLKVFEVVHESEYDPRIMLSKEIFRILARLGIEKSLVIFSSRNSENFRLSLVTISIKFDESNKIVKEYSNPRRYSFFLGPGAKAKTPKQYLDTQANRPKTFPELLKRFSVEAVTDEFYDNFSPIFEDIAESVRKRSKRTVTEAVAKDFTLLFAIRTIFIGFLQKKGWIGNDKAFLDRFWNEYHAKAYGKDIFYDKWLKALFFEALNSPPMVLIKYKNPDFPKEIKEALEKAPYLNGGLFQEKQGVDDIGLSISDKDIKRYFDFLFQYNFTIEENTYYDQDLELNPEFLGIIFERLVNKADGAVYTPRTEVDFMCRLSLVKWLEKNNTTSVDKKDLYELFFMEIGKGDALEEDQKGGSFSKRQVEDLLNLIENITICDPAVGSGAFPVGMLQVIDEIECELKKRKGDDPTRLSRYERKKRIIGRSLYGVEVKPWAVWICQLRLWITIFIDAPENLRVSMDPILPSLDFKIGCGDSLVQMVGSKHFAVSGNINLPSLLKKKITQLKNDKIDYFNNKKKNKQMISHDEYIIFLSIVDEGILEKEKEIRSYNQPKHTGALSAELEIPEQESMVFNEKRISELKEQIAELKEEKQTLKEGHPFIWSIEFPEIFFEKGGFDVVIGNPPYVRQESIADPNGKIKDKKDYKNALEEMVRLDFPKAFPAKKKINAQSDLYTYFYIRSLRLLNENGIHTFICSNSWLDVSYGGWLQEFLVDNARIHFVIDNQVQRSFAGAQVNTIITLIDSPGRRIDQNQIVKFIAFKKPFEEVVYTEKLMLIEEAKDIYKNEEFRVYPKTLIDLKQEGWDYGSGYEESSADAVEERKANYGFSVGKYAGQKWGGIYLRAPDIYFKLLEKGKDKLVQLGDVADVRFGIKTGCNDFFYLESTSQKSPRGVVFVKNGVGWEGLIEKEFLKPIIKSPKECLTIEVDPANLKYNIFFCNKSKSELKGTHALRYIEYGEKQKTEEGILWTDIPSVQGRKYWYGSGVLNSEIVWPSTYNPVFKPAYNPGKILIDKVFYGIECDNPLGLLVSITSYIFALQAEIVGYALVGGGGLFITVEDLERLYVLKPTNIHQNKKLYLQERVGIFQECGIDTNSETPIQFQVPNPSQDRIGLDKVAFDALGLTNEERKEVYRAVCQMARNRISKAKSM